MAKSKKPSAFDVKLTDEEKKTLGGQLAQEVEDAFNARSEVIADGGLIDLADFFYEQGRTDPANLPFPGAADLTSYFITENVDALRARLMKAVFGVRPFCFVEGWGADAKKAPYVEEFMDWQARKGDLPLALGRTVHGALIEDCYILEVSEKVETRRMVETIDVALQVHPETGGAIFDADGKPAMQMDGDEPVIAQQGQASAKVERTYTKTKRLGPQFDPISMKDFVFLPGHAKGNPQVWGYAYRVWKRLPELQEAVEDGIYDETAVKNLGDSSDRELETVATPVSTVATQQGPAAEKELIQVSLKRDLDQDGREEWYIATLSLKTRDLLRLKLDKFAMKVGRSRCVPFVLFPRRDSVYGYSYAFCKLLTLAEEHTALRNMKADRSALATNSPIQQVAGGLWDPEAQPIGVGRIITVRDAKELMPMQFPDVPSSVIESERSLLSAKERVGGLADASIIGVTSEDRRTATENKLIAGGSGVRVDEIVGYLHKAISEVMILAHAIWVETLEAEGGKGLDAPDTVMKSLQLRGQDDFDGKFTADQLKGDFQFEPYGTDETADPNRRRSDFNNRFMTLANLGKVFPGIQVIFQSPDAVKAILEEWCRVYNVRDRQPFLGALNAPPVPPPAGPMGPPPMGGPPVGPPGALPPELLAALTGAGGPPAPGPTPGGGGGF